MTRLSDWLARSEQPFRLALSFLTILPVHPRESKTSESDLAAARYAFPVVGLLIGIILAALSLALSRLAFAPGAAAFLLLLASVALTGGLHLDGLADAADGLFLWGERERRLRVMRDPHVGSFGIVAIVLVLLGKYAVLAEIFGSTRAWVVLGVPVVGRSLILVSAGLGGYARPEGTGRILIEATTFRDSQWAGFIVLVVGLIVGGAAGLVAAAVVVGLTMLFSRFAVQQIGGVTGDTLGAVVEGGECVFLTLLMIGQHIPSA